MRRYRVSRSPLSALPRATPTPRQFIATLKLDTYDRLPGIKTPTLVATGTEDILVPPENSRVIAGQIPGAKLVVYKGAGHAFIDQAREEFIADLLEFLG